jgi:xanthine dehydrogenase YagR molybdenum-binding subunit
MPANAILRLRPDGSELVRCCTQDIGTGTYAIIAQVATDALGLSVDRIKVEIGDARIVSHACRKRVRELPITPAKLLA